MCFKDFKDAIIFSSKNGSQQTNRANHQLPLESSEIVRGNFHDIVNSVSRMSLEDCDAVTLKAFLGEARPNNGWRKRCKTMQDMGETKM